MAAAALVAAIVAFALTPPIPQDPGYHDFADGRTLLGVPNALNVLSNLPFLVVGFLGLRSLRRHRVEPRLDSAYTVFFLGILLTAFGSGYYHLAPANEPLVWDRLPMTIGFAGLFTVVVGEFVSIRTASRMLYPLLVACLASVAYWAWTEARGAGDLRPYALVQFLPMLLTIAILIMHRRPHRLRAYVAAMIGLYGLAKLAEYFDAELYAAGQLLSGHSIKHLLAAAVPAVLLYGIGQRDSRFAPSSR